MIRVKMAFRSVVGIGSAGRRKVRAFLGLPVATKLLLLPACLLMLFANLAILALPFWFLCRTFGVPFGASALVPLVQRHQEMRAEHVARAIAIAARMLPTRTDCYPQAISATFLCRSLGVPYALHFGVALDGTGQEVASAMYAHAWLAAGRIVVPVGPSFGRFKPVACFLSPKVSERLPMPRRATD